jgi:hypothetical protein
MNNYVYKHTTEDTREVFYVGRGNGKRIYDKVNRNPFWKNVEKKHGRKVDIIASNLSSDEAACIEAFWINIYGLRVLNEGNLVNINIEGYTSSTYKKTYESIRKTADKLMKPVYKYDIYGNLLSLFNSISEADGNTSTLSIAIHNKWLSNGFIYSLEELSLDDIKLIASKGKNRNTSRKRKVYVIYDDSIKLFNSVKEAAEYTGIGNTTIYRRLNDGFKSHNGYIFKYKQL